MPAPTKNTPTQQETHRKNIVIVAGEASGDAHAARLINELKKLDPEISVRGMGGDNLRDAGVDVFIDMAELAVVGLVEVLLKYNVIKAELNKLKRNIASNPPDLLILVDYQEFNQRLAAYAKSIGIKVLFYIGPQVWAWRPKRIYKMAKIVDHMAVILPFEKELYEKAHIAVTFTGHPLTDEVVQDKTKQQAREKIGIADKTTLGLFPGSRHGEVKRLLPILLETAKLIRKSQQHDSHGQNHNAEIQFILPMASTISDDELAPYTEALKALSVKISREGFYDIIQSCDVIISASGTAILEIALLEVPMVITAKIAALSYLVLNKMINLSHLGLVNIVAGKEIVKEFIQNDATPEALTKEALRLLNDTDYYESMRHELSQIRQQLGGGEGSKNVAKLAYTMMNEPGMNKPGTNKLGTSDSK